MQARYKNDQDVNNDQIEFLEQINNIMYDLTIRMESLLEMIKKTKDKKEGQK